MSVPASRTLQAVLRAQLAHEALTMLVGKVVSAPDEEHVRVEIQGAQVTVPRLTSYSEPVPGEPAYLLSGPLWTMALGTVGGLGGGGEPPPGAYDANYVHTQLAAAASWSVTHGLNKYPAVEVVDTGNNVVIPDVRYLDTNSVLLTFGSPTSGKAVFN